MPVSTIDPRTALIVIDLQKGIVGLPTAHPIAGVIANSRALADAFRKHNLPVVLVNVSGAPGGRTESPRRGSAYPDGWDILIDELDTQPGDHLVTKHTRGAFHQTGLHELLSGLDVTQVIIAGVSTSAGVESTARQAHEYGYNVTLAIDAMTDTDADSHHNSVTRIFPKMAETGTTAEILALLP
ncbi:isochorismatase family protein [soil metagenome]